ncbi:MAG TPA: acyl-CoA thioesterase [Alphaproteobacteria bacterium]|jgi:acyl-CoA thioesterase YciA|nr:acyl-CoA thioesterase [Alphaproteobacteria bacterium]
MGDRTRKTTAPAGEPEGAGPQGELCLQTVAMPADTNPRGDIFGGWILSQMDIAGGILAHQRAKGRTATVAIESMKFHLPVFVGDVVGCYGAVVRTGRTSIAIKIEAWARRGHSAEMVRVTEGVFTYVAIDEQRRPRPLPES